LTVVLTLVRQSLLASCRICQLFDLLVPLLDFWLQFVNHFDGPARLVETAARRQERPGEDDQNEATSGHEGYSALSSEYRTMATLRVDSVRDVVESQAIDGQERLPIGRSS
jgi:hypothetical protein